MVILFIIVALCCAYDDVLDIIEDLDLLRAKAAKPPAKSPAKSPAKLPTKLNLAASFFSTLGTYHFNGKVATEATYPWIAQVVHSSSANYPYMCTCVCVHDGIFMTAARCIYNLKVKHTSVLYRSKRHAVRAFIVPSKSTAQQFDDIAFIVLEKKAAFTVAPLYTKNEVKRTDQAFNWFSKMNLAGPFKVVGYVMNKAQHSSKSPESPHTLRELPIVINIDLCWNILTNNKLNGFRLPCYHSCSLPAFGKAGGKCGGYLAVEGAAIVNTKTKKVLGLAIWGPRFGAYDLPVGFSVVNSNTFLEDFECAKKVKNAKPKTGSYQNLCKL